MKLHFCVLESIFQVSSISIMFSIILSFSLYIIALELWMNHWWNIVSTNEINEVMNIHSSFARPMFHDLEMGFSREVQRYFWRKLVHTYVCMHTILPLERCYYVLLKRYNKFISRGLCFKKKNFPIVVNFPTSTQI